MTLDEEYYIPHKVKDIFKRSPHEMLYYFKQSTSNKWTSGDEDNIHKLVEQIEFLSYNLQHYDDIIINWKNYYLLESFYSLNLVNKLLKSGLNLGKKFWTSICKNKHCLGIISKNIDKLDMESWYNLSYIDKELEILKTHSKICIDNIILLYFYKLEEYIELGEKCCFDVDNFWRFLVENPKSSYIITSNKEILDDAFQLLKQDILEEHQRNKSELNEHEKSDWTIVDSFNQEEDFCPLFSFYSSEEVVKKRKTEDPEDPNTNLSFENKRIIDQQSLFRIIKNILSNKNETSYIIENIDMIIKMCPSRVWCRVFANDNLTQLFDIILSKYIDIEVPLGECRPSHPIPSWSYIPMIMSDFIDRETTHAETILNCLNALFENTNQSSTNYIKILIPKIKDNLNNFKINNYTFEILFLNPTHTSVFNDIINLHPQACSEPYGIGWLIHEVGNTNYLIQNFKFLESKSILSINQFFNIENKELMTFVEEYLDNNTYHFDNDEIRRLLCNPYSKKIVEKNSFIVTFITQDNNSEIYLRRFKHQFNNCHQFPYQLLANNLSNIHISKLKYLLTHPNSIDFIVEYFDSLYERFEGFQKVDNYNNLIAIIHEHTHGPSILKKRWDKANLILNFGTLDIQKEKLFLNNSISHLVENEEFVEIFENLLNSGDSKIWNELFTRVIIDDHVSDLELDERGNYVISKLITYMYENNAGIYKIDYKYLSDKMNIHTEDIMKKVYKPERVQYYLDKYSYDIGLDEYENY